MPMSLLLHANVKEPQFGSHGCVVDLWHMVRHRRMTEKSKPLAADAGPYLTNSDSNIRPSSGTPTSVSNMQLQTLACRDQDSSEQSIGIPASVFADMGPGRARISLCAFAHQRTDLCLTRLQTTRALSHGQKREQSTVSAATKAADARDKGSRP